MALSTAAASGEINLNAINDTDGRTARELLCITESAVDALSPSRSRLSARGQKSSSSFVTVQTENTDDIKNLSTESRSSTASEILRRSTQASTALGAKSSLSPSETARLIRVPVKVLREVPVPHYCMFSNQIPMPHNNFNPRVQLHRKPDQLVDADKLNSDQTTRRKWDKKVKEDSQKMHPGAHSSEVGNPRIFAKPLCSTVETGSGIKEFEFSESNSVHPLMAILDNGCLTQPIHTIVAEERLSSGDSHSTSMATSASPIEVLAQDKQTGIILVLCMVLKVECLILLFKL